MMKNLQKTIKQKIKDIRVRFNGILTPAPTAKRDKARGVQGSGFWISRNKLSFSLIVVIMSVFLGIILIPGVRSQVFPNSEINESFSDSGIYGSVNPSFRVAFGDRENPDVQKVRFETKAEGDSPFIGEVEDMTFWEKVEEFFTGKESKGVEFSLVESSVDGDLSKIDTSDMKLLTRTGISTSTELEDLGRTFSDYYDEVDEDDEVSKDTVINKDVVEGVDIEYQIIDGIGLKEEILLKWRDEYSSNCENNCVVPPNTFTFELVLDDGVELHSSITSINGNTGGAYYFTDEKGRYLAHFLPSFAEDNTGSKTNNVDFSIEELDEKGMYEIILSLDLDWLLSSERVYPIRIDPSIVHDTEGEFNLGESLNRIESTSGPKVQLVEQELPADEHTVGLWHMNETANDTCSGGQDVCDVSGSGYHGTESGTVIDTSTPKIGAAARTFTAGDDVSLGSQPFVDSATDITVEAWVYSTEQTASTHYRLFSEENVLYVGHYGGQVSFYMGNGTSWTHSSVAGGALEINSWNHIAWVKEGTTAYVYINGKNTLSMVAPMSLGTSANVNYISTYDGTNQPWVGGVDEVRISNIARTPEEIKANSQKRPYGTYISDTLDLTSNVSSIDDLQWIENAVATGDGETPYSTTGLVAQWDFNETSGTTADNEGSCGASCDGTLTNMTTTGQDVVAGSGWTANNRKWGVGALMFDGSNDYVTLSNNTSLNFTTEDFSMETWFKTSKVQDTTWPTIISKENGSPRNGPALVLTATGVTSDASFAIFSGGTQAAVYSTSSANSLRNGQWHHIVGTKTSNSLSIYIDGKFEGLISHTLGSISNTSYPFTIGRRASDVHYFNGTIDSTRIYSRALSANEILSNYNATNIEFLTRTSSDGLSWEEWKPTTGETQIDSMDSSTIQPNAISGLQTWLKADAITGVSDGAQFGTWNDSSGNNNNFTQATGTKQPTYMTDIINGNPVVRFSAASSQTMTNSLNLSSGANTIIYVVRQTGGSNYRMLSGLSNNWLLGYWNGAKRQAFFEGWVSTSGSPLTDTSWHIYSAVQTGSKSSVWEDGNNFVSSSTSGITGPNGFSLVGYLGTSEFSNGDIAELVVYNKALNELDRGEIENYLANKYGLSVSTPLRYNTDIISKQEGTGSKKISMGIPQPDGSTVGLWHLDETGGTGAYIKDSTSNANHGTPTGTTVVQGISGKARSFNGSSDYINRNSSPNTSLTNWTLEAWIKPDNLSQLGLAVYNSNDTSGYGFGIGNGAGSSGSKLTGLFGGVAWIDSGYTFPNSNQWYYVVMNRDTSTTRFYVNGVQTGGTSSSTPGAVAAQFNIGNMLDSSNLPIRYFAGDIDEVKLSNVKKTPEEIAEAYRMGRDHRISTSIPSTDVSLSSKLPFWVAGDRPGTYLEATVGESAYANLTSDSSTVGLWHMDDYRYKDSSVNGNDGIDTYYGIPYGIQSSNLTFIANQWNGAANDGEIDITCPGGDSFCAIVTMDGNTISTPSINYGVAMIETAAVSAFIMYSPSLTGQGITPYANGSNNYIGVKYTGSVWQYDNNSAWVTFTPNGTNILVASLTTGNPAVTSLSQIDHPSVTSGIIGKAKSFNGSSDYILTSSFGFDYDNISIEAWVNVNSLAARRTIIDIGTETSLVPQLEIGTCLGGTNAVCVITPGIWQAQTVDNVVSTKEWIHIVYTKSGIGATHKIYVNGVQQLLTTNASADYTPTSVAKNIGKRGNGAQYFPGIIDEVRISDIARTPTEIRQSYEIGLRTHPVTIDFAASLDSGNLIANSSDKTFTIDSTTVGLSEMGSNLFNTDKVIVKENYDGTEYIAQGDVISINESTGAVEVDSWDAGSTFPSGGFTANATVFKWQREYFDITEPLDSHLDAVTNITLRVTNGNEGRNVWLDDFKSAGYLTDSTATSNVTSTAQQYLQYMAVLSTSDTNVTPYLSEVTLNYGTGPSLEQIMRHGKWFSGQTKQNFWWSQ